MNKEESCIRLSGGCDTNLKKREAKTIPLQMFTVAVEGIQRNIYYPTPVQYQVKLHSLSTLFYVDIGNDRHAGSNCIKGSPQLNTC